MAVEAKIGVMFLQDVHYQSGVTAEGPKPDKTAWQTQSASRVMEM